MTDPTLILDGRGLVESPRWHDGHLWFADYYVLTVLDEAAAFFPSAMSRIQPLAAYRQRMYARPALAAYAASGRQPTAYGFDPIRNLRTPAKAA